MLITDSNNRAILVVSYKGRSLFRTNRENAEWVMTDPRTGKVHYAKRIKDLTQFIDKAELSHGNI